MAFKSIYEDYINPRLGFLLLLLLLKKGLNISRPFFFHYDDNLSMKPFLLRRRTKEKRI